MASVHALIQKLKTQGISNPKVLAAIKKIPREKFIAKEQEARAYENMPLPIEDKQTISQPYIVALMTELLLTEPLPHRVLEIGTGSGYQTAILASLFEEIWTIERIERLSEHAKDVLSSLHFKNIHYKWGDGYKGWPSHAPFDGIIVTAAAETIPKALLEQLSPNQGKLVIPVGQEHKVQKLTFVERQGDKYISSIIESVSFVPMLAKRQGSSPK